MGEVALAALLCGFLAGSAAEERYYFDVYDIKRYVRVDCETATHVIEIGLDGKASSRDSIHQALFAAGLAKGKIPAVIMIDRRDDEGKRYEDRYEYEMRRVTGMLGMAYARCTDDWIKAWQARGGMRVVPDGTDDLPAEAWASSACDLSQIVGPNPVVPVFITPELAPELTPELTPQLPSGDVRGVVGVSAPLEPADE